MSITYKNPEIETPHAGSVVSLPYGFGPLPESNKKIFFFDIDNCLYSRSSRIHDLMQVKIHEYFKSHLALGDKEAHDLHMNYYKTYGLALEGLVRNHKVDALAYNAQVDDSLDLKSVLSYNEPLRNMLLEIKQNFDHLWLVTNAYKNHALRVISFLGLGDLFDGLTYCDYSQSPIVCKPMTPFFNRVLEITRTDAKNAYFVDDSEINCKAAFDLGWSKIIHFIELDEDYATISAKDDFSQYYSEGKIIIIRNILDLNRAIS